MNRRLVIQSLAVGISFALLMALGTWQLRRLDWKQGLIDRIEARATAPPVPLDEILLEWRAAGDIEYLPVRLSGRFDHDRERHLFAINNGAPGWHIITPLVLGYGRIVFVNRGFVPDGLKARKKRPLGLIDGEVTVSGLVREALTTKRPFVPDNDPVRNIWYWRSLSGMTASVYDKTNVRVLPFFVDARPSPVPGGWPKGGTTRLVLPNKHLGYALTWYGLGLTLLVVYGFFGRAQMRQDDSRPVGSPGPE